VREEYLRSASGKSHLFPKEVNDDRIFPFEENKAYAIWKNALRKTGYFQRDKVKGTRLKKPIIQSYVLLTIRRFLHS